MEGNKNPRIPPWKVWILIITTVQVMSAFQNYWVHQRMWDSILNTQSSLIQALQVEIEYQQNLNQVLDLIDQQLQALQ